MQVFPKQLPRPTRKVYLAFTCVVFFSVFLQKVENGYASLAKIALEDVSREASSIVVAEVTHTQSQWEGGSIYTYVTVSIEQYIKGAGDKQITIKVPGGRVGNVAQFVSDTPNFQVGERAILFLKDQFFRVVGWRQGKYAIVNRRVVSDEGVEDETDFVNRVRSILGMPLLEREVAPGSEVTQAGPVITNVIPATTASGTRGRPPFGPGGGISDIVITGNGFGPSPGRVAFIGDQMDSDRIYLWSDDRIECHIPCGSFSWDIRVYDAGGTSSTPYDYVITFGTRWQEGYNHEVKWPKPAMGEDFLVNENCPDVDDELSAIQAAMGTWNDAGADFTFTYGGSTTVDRAQSDGYNVIAWSDLDDNRRVATCSTSYHWPSCDIFECDIVFNTYFTWSATGEAGKMDIQNIATHELGHALLLTDLYGNADWAKTMCGHGSLGETKRRSLEPDDISGILYLYGFRNPVPDIAVTPASWDYGDIVVGSYSDKTFVVSDPGSAPLEVTGTDLTGTGISDFSIQSGGGSFSLDPGDAHEIVIRFEPSSLGDKSAVLSLASNVDGKNPLYVPLRGTGSITIVLTSPNGGEVWRGGSSQDIRWETSGPWIEYIRLLYSTDGGNIYPDTIAATTENDGIHTWTLPVLDSGTVRVKATAEDSSNAELATDVSDGDLMIDSTAPATSIASLEGTQGDNNWWISDVKVTLSATDNLSGIKEITYRIDDGSRQAYLEPFTVTGSTVYYSSEDNAGNAETENLQEIEVDKTKPLVPVVTDEGDYTNSTTQLHASWTASSDDESGIVEYEYAIGPTSDASQMVGWKSAGADTEVTATDLDLTRGQTYYIGVKAKNGAGLWSSVGVSDGIAINVPPVVNDIPDVSFVADTSDSSIDLDDYVDDPDNSDDEVTWTYTGNTNVNVFIDPITRVVTFTALFDWNGIESITFTATDPGGLSSSDYMTVTVTQPGIVIDPVSWDYGNVLSGSYFDKTFTVSNPGSGILDVTAISLTDGRDFLIQSGSNSFSLDPGDTHNIVVRFAPSSTGVKAATLSLANNVADKNPFNVLLQGNGVIATITLTSPNGREVWIGGSSHDIAWEALGSSVDHIRLLYSTDSGNTYPNTIVANTDNDGTYTWTVPLLDSDTVWVKAIAEDSSNVALAEDVSNGDFAVTTTIHVATTGSDTDGDGGQASPYRTIQKGIDEATDECTVLVADGTHTGIGNRDLDFGGKAITVRSENGAELTIIDCEGVGRGFYFHLGETSGSVVSGFTITNGSPSGGDGAGIYCVYFSSPTIEDNIITANSANREGGGIYCSSSSPVIQNNTIDRNSARWGGGIECANSSSPIIRGNTITGNLAERPTDGDYGAGGIGCCDSSPTIRDNKISENSGHDGGGIQCRGSSFPVIQNNEISDNSADDRGGGIYCHGAASPTVQSNKISRNSALYGGGINCYGDSSPTIQNNEVSGNAASWGGAILCSGANLLLIINNTIIGNRATGEGGGIYCKGSSSLTVLNTICWDNAPQEFYIAESAAVGVSYSDIQNGFPGEGNMDVLPRFVDGYHLDDGSSCIGAGMMTPYVPDVDIEGNPRPDPPGSGPDMGAYENGLGEPLSIFECEVKQGWNLISLPVNSRDNALQSVLTSVWASVNSVWTYKANSGWSRHVVGGPDSLNDLTTMESGRGYWISMINDAILSVAGRQVTNTNTQLRGGWNLVGYNCEEEKDREMALSSIAELLRSIWTYDNGKAEWLRYVVGAPNFLNSLTHLGPGSGYWISVTEDCAWDVSR